MYEFFKCVGVKQMTKNIGFDFDETLHFNYKPTYLLNLFKLYYMFKENNRHVCKMFIITKNQDWSAKRYDPNLIKQDMRTHRGYHKNIEEPITKIHLWLEQYCAIPGIASNCTVIGVPYTSSKGKVIVDNKIQVFFDDYDLFLNAIYKYIRRRNYNKIILYKISEKKKNDGRIESVYYNGFQDMKKVSNSHKKLIPPDVFFTK